jgi:hypothetical protein
MSKKLIAEAYESMKANRDVYYECLKKIYKDMHLKSNTYLYYRAIEMFGENGTHRARYDTEANAWRYYLKTECSLWNRGKTRDKGFISKNT